MIEADPFEPRQRGAFDARRPGQEHASLMLLFQGRDEPSPQSRRGAVGIQAAEPGDARLHQAREPVQPPFRHRLGDLGLLQSRIGDVEPMRRPPGAGQRATAAWREPVVLAAADRGIDRDLVDGQIKPDAQAMLRGLLRDASNAGIGRPRPAQAPGAAPRGHR